jgi:hypothetical protein
MGAGLALIGLGTWPFDAWLFVEYTFVREQRHPEMR